jgi:hypothetical protein
MAFLHSLATNPNLIWTVVALAVGVVISAVFHWRATVSLRAEADKLRRLHELTLYAFVNREAKLEPRLNQRGEVVGLIVSATGRASSSSQA